MRNSILHRLLALLVIVLAICAGKTNIYAVSTIHNGIFIGGIDMSGKTVSEANSIIEGDFEDAKNAVITFTSPTGYDIVVSPQDLGMKWNNPNVVNDAASFGIEGNVVQRYKQGKDLEREHIDYNVDISFSRDNIREILVANADQISREAQDYELNVDGGEFVIKKGQSGVQVDIEASVSAIISYLKNGWNKKDVSIELIASVEEPHGSESELTTITDIIGSYTTSYKASSASRIKNVTNGCKLISGSTLYPGEQFSVLKHLVPFTSENGYALAGSYMNGLVVDTFGGGICQVSSTLYNAVLLAELQVDERSNHSMIVDYVSPSGDAAIAESSGKDFKFTNNKDYPIYIEGYTTEDKTITFNIYGIEDRPENREISFRSEVIERNVADYEAIVQDGSKPIGYTSITSSHAGIKARYIKEVRVDGVLESSTEINKSSYKMVPRTIVVGTATGNPDAYNQLQEAIATGSVDHVKATANALAAAAATPPQEEVTAGDP